MQEIRKKLNSLSDQEYKKFHSSLCPNAKYDWGKNTRTKKNGKRNS